ncbi:hypothetical protein ABID82_007046 [Methylobacterium sp. PvP062]|uniref:Uncharacterized protein n=1 Tax=Methylobacterium radiotolerans TaxID=31998 RepID=A0ABV2NIE0_9HYPH|nr:MULTISPECIES: hypothetical protein [unclassified Methylobacterium]MBP2496995.1 hypothetical protein [Methylobacterium sp. PvP105]MBP2503134.1 hypothetical protein [Methylobacterium sp. PvP109]MCX7336055.1 hypothetical protein [Hyphomicrobiales bacterium]
MSPIDPETLDHVRLGLLGGRVVPCRVPADVLRDLSHPDDLARGPRDVVLSDRAAIARVATETSERAGAPDGCLDRDQADFFWREAAQPRPDHLHTLDGRAELGPPHRSPARDRSRDGP